MISASDHIAGFTFHHVRSGIGLSHCILRIEIAIVLLDVSECLTMDMNHLQEPQHEYTNNSSLLCARHLELPYLGDWQCYNDEVGDDIEGAVEVPDNRDIFDAFAFDRMIPHCLEGYALKKGHKSLRETPQENHSHAAY